MDQIEPNIQRVERKYGCEKYDLFPPIFRMTYPQSLALYVCRIKYDFMHMFFYFRSFLAVWNLIHFTLHILNGIIFHCQNISRIININFDHIFWSGLIYKKCLLCIPYSERAMSWSCFSRCNFFLNFMFSRNFINSHLFLSRRKQIGKKEKCFFKKDSNPLLRNSQIIQCGGCWNCQFSVR